MVDESVWSSELAHFSMLVSRLVSESHALLPTLALYYSNTWCHNDNDDSLEPVSASDECITQMHRS
jgi:hypothetical protein